jgi:putative transposase
MPDSLDQLDLLLMQEVRARKVRQDGIHFEGLRYLSTTLAAYVGETIMIRFDPRDMGEIRVFHQEKFLCQAVAADLAGSTVPLREILRARNRRRQDLRSIIQNRQQAVDTLLELKRGSIPEEAHAKLVVAKPPASSLKRYRNE